MDAIITGLSIGFTLFLIAGILGVINPKIVKQQKRGKAFLVNIIPAIVLLTIIGFLSLKNEKTGSGNLDKTSQKPSEKQATPIKTPSTETKKNSMARKNIEIVIDSLQENYGIHTKYNVGEDYCINDNFCEALADSVHIQAMGYKVDALPSEKVAPSYYLSVCSSILIALSGANKELAEQVILQHFNFASNNGQANSNTLGVNITINATSSGLLECDFVKPR